MSARLAAWIVGALALAIVLSLPRERRRFATGALGAAVAMLGTPHRLRAGILAAGMAAAFAAGLLGF